MQILEPPQDWVRHLGDTYMTSIILPNSASHDPPPPVERRTLYTTESE